jgi:DNA-binding transcriptional LysR family regulator
MALDLAQWRVFLAAADCGSLIKAAEVLHTDQPALSRSLRRLEVLIGGPLFVRSSRGLTLTELGRRLRVPVRELIDQATTVETLAHAEARQISGILRVGAVDVYPMTEVIADACRELTVAGRTVAVEVIGLPWLAHPGALRQRTIDVGFTLTVAGRLPDPSIMRSQPLWDEPETFALIASHHPLADADLIDPRDLADLPLHLPDKADNPDIYNLILEQLADAGVASPRRAPPLGSFATVIAHIAAGDGWSLSARTLARQTPPGIAARPLAVTPRHTVRFEIIWHIHTDPETIATFAQRVQDALADHHLT